MTTSRSLTSLVICVAVLVGGAVFVRSVPAAPAAPAARASVAVGKSQYGQILFDGRGFALYASTHDTRSKATCYGECAAKWPPYPSRASRPPSVA
jgi:predicted lipoprotein with Yx(FWY)xxD motif